jgi:hypothetical protein
MDHACSILLEEVIIPVPDWASLCNAILVQFTSKTPKHHQLFLILSGAWNMNSKPQHVHRPAQI